MTRIAIDCMGGDHGLTVTVPAALSFLRRVHDVRLLLVGRAEEIERAVGDAPRDRIEIVPASEVVEMAEQPKQAFRKRDSSMRVAITLVKDGRADACVSAGNTGALMMISYFVLETLDGIERPAIATAIPNEKGGVTTMLDLGANAQCEPQHLLQFAIMGSALVSAVDGKERPTVGLLNIGEEEGKGHEEVRQAGELLKASPLNFHGNVEGNDIFKGTTDVVVCDGFVGNVALKTSEGLAQMLGGFIKEEFTRNLFTKLIAALALPVLNRLRKRVDHRRYNGAALLGLKGVVVKSHGSADAYAFEWAINRACEEVRSGVMERTQRAIASMTPAVKPEQREVTA